MPKVRKGKTLRDHNNNNAIRNENNKAARREWQNSSRSTTMGAEQQAAKNFPLDTCNGKKSRALKSKTQQARDNQPRG